MAYPRESRGGCRRALLDARPANRPGIEYPVFEMLMPGIVPNRPNRLNPGPIWLPTMHPRDAQPVDTSRDTVVKLPQFPGLEVALPKGTTLRDVDGRPVTRVNAALIPLDRGPFPMPPHVKLAFMYTIQPSGSVSDRPMTITLPNPMRLPAGTRLTLWAHDPRKGGWYNPGQATVTPDGRQIVPDPGVTVTRFSCLGAAWPPANKRVLPDGVMAGEPVDLASGVFVLEKTDLVIPGRIPFIFRRTYRSEPNTACCPFRPLGSGWDHNLNLYLGTGAAGYSGWQVVLPTDFHLNFPSNGPLHTETPAFYGAKLSGGTPYPFHVTLKDGTRWGFHDFGVLVGIEDRHQNKLTIDRLPLNTLAHVSKVTLPDGRQVFFEYDSSWRITKIMAPLDQIVEYTYTMNGDLATVKDPLGGVTTYTYDSSHNLLTVKDPRNIVYLTNDYSAGSKRVLRQTQADTGTWFFRYQLAGATVTGPGCPGSPPACPTEETYENAINPGGYTFTGGTVIATKVIDPRGKQTTYTFNAAGYATNIQDHLGQNTSLTREAGTNLVTQTVDPLGRRTEFTYGDANKNLTQIKRFKDLANTQPVTWTFAYDTTADKYNLLTSYTDPLSHTWTFGLDAAKKNVVSVTNPLLKVWNIGRNSFGQVTSITPPAPANFATNFAYDPTLGLLSTITDPLNNVTTRSYDPLGRLVSQTDPRGFTTQFTYDLLNRVTGLGDALGHGISFEYDPNGNLTKVTDPRGGTILYEYDGMDRMQKRTDPVGKFDTYTYEPTGHLKTVTDRKNQQTIFTYDDLNRRATATYKQAGGATEATVTYQYDVASRLTQLQEVPGATITWVLDPLDRFTSETTPQGSVQFPDDPNPALAGYDDAGRRKRMIVSGGATLTYTYDNADRLLTVAADGGLQATYSYDDADRRTALELLNAVKTEYGYDTASRLTSLTYKQGMTTLGQLLHTYDPAGNRLTLGGSGARTTLPTGFTPCASSSVCYDLANRHLPGVSVGGKKVTYDFNGNATQLDEGAITNFTWNARDRLTGLSGAATASFSYDALGRRTAKTIGVTTTTFRYDGWDIVREVIDTSGVNYLRGLAIDEPLLRTEGTSTSQYLSDALGSTWALTNDTGAITTAYRYGAFGQTIVDSGSNPNAFQFTGRENDGTELYHYRARSYHPTLSRFLSEDPLYRDVGLYQYVGNNPTGYVDPSGLIRLGGGRIGTGGRPSQAWRPPPDRGRIYRQPRTGGDPELIQPPGPPNRYIPANAEPFEPHLPHPHVEWPHWVPPPCPVGICAAGTAPSAIRGPTPPLPGARQKEAPPLWHPERLTPEERCQNQLLDADRSNFRERYWDWTGNCRPPTA